MTIWHLEAAYETIIGNWKMKNGQQKKLVYETNDLIPYILKYPQTRRHLSVNKH